MSGAIAAIAFQPSLERATHRPAIERIVRSHLSDLVKRAEAEKPEIGR